MHACRYCGLYEQSIAAHDEARRLDPNVPTSVEQTILMTGDIERLLAAERPRSSAAATKGSGSSASGWPGVATRPAVRLLEMRKAPNIPTFSAWTEYLLAWLDGRSVGMLVEVPGLDDLKIMDDPEAIFQEGWLLCDVGEHELGLGYLQRAVAKGYFVAPTLVGQPAIRRAAGRSRASSCSWRKPKRAASRPWPRSAMPVASDSSAAVIWRAAIGASMPCSTS